MYQVSNSICQQIGLNWPLYCSACGQGRLINLYTFSSLVDVHCYV